MSCSFQIFFKNTLHFCVSQIAQDVAETSRTDRPSLRWTDSGTWAALSVRPAAKCWPGSTSASKHCTLAPARCLTSEILGQGSWTTCNLFTVWSSKLTHPSPQGWRPLLWEGLPDPFWRAVRGVSSVYHRKSVRGKTAHFLLMVIRGLFHAFYVEWASLLELLSVDITVTWDGTKPL